MKTKRLGDLAPGTRFALPAWSGELEVGGTVVRVGPGSVTVRLAGQPQEVSFKVHDGSQISFVAPTTRETQWSPGTRVVPL